MQGIKDFRNKVEMDNVTPEPPEPEKVGQSLLISVVNLRMITCMKEKTMNQPNMSSIILYSSSVISGFGQTS